MTSALTEECDNGEIKRSATLLVTKRFKISYSLRVRAGNRHLQRWYCKHANAVGKSRLAKTNLIIPSPFVNIVNVSEPSDYTSGPGCSKAG